MTITSAKGKKEMSTEIPDTRYNREWVKGLKPFQSGKVPEEFKWLYSKEEIEELAKADIESRMIAGISKHYMQLAKKSTPILNLIKARKEETQDMSGEVDPSNQLHYSPVAGLLHKYEIILLYVARTCSAHCRYCYRLDLFTGKTDKPMANVEEIQKYVIDHNKKVETVDQSNVDPEDRIYKIREVLLSGGDPMVLSNSKLFEYMDGMAQVEGVSTVRIGTKELAFFPERFDDNFIKMLEIFHSKHPKVNINFIIHFTHPHEFLEVDDNENYIMTKDGPKWIDVTEKAIEKLRALNFVSLENQTPIIYKVNDDADAIRLMQLELRRKGVHNHYFFQCREIEGHRAFAVPVEETWRLHNRSQAGLSGVERSRLTMSTEHGKLEVISVIDGPDSDLGDMPKDEAESIKKVFGDGLVILKAHRAPFAAENQGDLIIARRNPEALWITGYEDRIIYDGRKIGKNKYAK